MTEGKAILLAHFLREVHGKRLADMISADVAEAALVLMLDLAAENPKFTKMGTLPIVPGVPQAVLSAFTHGLMMGVYLSSRGEATWPKKTS